MRLIVLSLEAFTPSALGCYGSSWCQTPAMDRLAAQGCLWDRCISRHATPGATIEQWFRSQWWHAWRQHGEIEFLCDEPSTMNLAAKQDFDQLFLCDPIDNGDLPNPTADIESTQFAELVAAAIERTREANPPSVMWIHSHVLSQRWDAPRWLVPNDELDFSEEPIEDDGLIEVEGAELESLEQLPWTFDEIQPPEVRLVESTHPDLIATWMRTYACQIRLVDDLIGILQDAVDEKTQIVVAGTSGFGFGQNGWISQSTGPLRTCHLHVPLLVNSGGPLRCPQLVSTDEFAVLLETLANNPDHLVDLGDWSKAQEEFDPQIASQGDDREQISMHTPKWFLSQQTTSDVDGVQLFLKPDDVHDANDVSRLRSDVVDTLLESLATHLPPKPK